jgi:hypothetical protein
MGVKLYNSLPSYIKEESKNIIKFESLLQKFFCLTILSTHSMNFTILYKDPFTNHLSQFLQIVLIISNAYSLQFGCTL